MESEKKQKISGLSYNIISYDPRNRGLRNLGLVEITQKVVADFLELVGVDASVQCLECSGRDELVSEWKTLEGRWRRNDNGAFAGQLLVLENKVTSEIQSSKIRKAILVTSMNIGEIIGAFYNNRIAIISSQKIEHNPERFATAVFHELGHMHGAPSTERKKVDRKVNNDFQIVELEKEMQGTNAIYESLGEHCLNLGCSMRQRLCFADWSLTKERLQTGRPYCDKCLDDLKDFFRKNPD